MLTTNLCLREVKVKIYVGKHQRAIRKGSQLVLTPARAPPKIKERKTIETNEDLAGYQPFDLACP